jgi:hypothetical protein
VRLLFFVFERHDISRGRHCRNHRTTEYADPGAGYASLMAPTPRCNSMYRLGLIFAESGYNPTYNRTEKPNLECRPERGVPRYLTVRRSLR